MDSYRYGYQGSEKDDEAKGGGNSYTTYYRQLDPRVGRWFSLDPKSVPIESPYVSMINNPIRFSDILGDKVDLKKEKDVSNKDFRKMKKNIKELRKNSESFEVMYNDLESRNETYTFLTSNESGGDAQNPLEIKIGTKFKQNCVKNEKESQKFAQMGLIAHETGHKFLETNGIVPAHADIEGMNGIDKLGKVKQVEYAKHHKLSETSAMHIENIVRSEISKNPKYKDIKVQQFYAPGFSVILLDPKTGSTFLNPNGEYDVFKELGIKKEYYDEKRDIKKEFGL